MKFVMLATASLLLGSTFLTANAYAKTLVYCSEGSPENFTPAINTTGTSFDAARPIYDKLVEFTPALPKPNLVLLRKPMFPLMDSLSLSICARVSNFTQA